MSSSHHGASGSGDRHRNRAHVDFHHDHAGGGQQHGGGHAGHEGDWHPHDGSPSPWDKGRDREKNASPRKWCSIMRWQALSTHDAIRSGGKWGMFLGRGEDDPFSLQGTGSATPGGGIGTGGPAWSWDAQVRERQTPKSSRTPHTRRRSSTNDALDMMDRVEWDGDMEAALEEAEATLKKTFRAAVKNPTYGKDKYGRALLMNLADFLNFFADLSQADMTKRATEAKLEKVYREVLNLQKDLSAGQTGVPIMEGLTLESFKLCLHGVANTLGLGVHITDVMQSYKDYVHSPVPDWKREALDELHM